MREAAREPANEAGARKRRFADQALTWMLFVLVVDIFLLMPVSELSAWTRHWSHIIVIGVLALGALLIWGNLWLTDVLVALCIAGIGARFGYMRWGGEAFLYFSYIAAAATFTLLGYLMARRVFAPGRVNMHRIQGAIAVYLLAGMILSQLFMLISLAHPGAFLLLGQPASHEQISGSLGYYSFVTLTTLGFGDITPVHPLARSFTLLGAVFGVLYPAILIGRLLQQEKAGGEG